MPAIQSFRITADLFQAICSNPLITWPDARSPVTADQVATLALSVVIDGAASRVVRSACAHVTSFELGSGVFLSPTADPDLIRAFAAAHSAPTGVPWVRHNTIVRQVRRDLLREFGLTTDADYPRLGTFAATPKLLGIYGGALAGKDDRYASRVLNNLVLETAGEVLADRIQTALLAHPDKLRPTAKRLLLAIAG
ncbi:MAG: hypothetical protein IT432_12190 [Phycisphaerales bacterium]|nr:hypothetical protein [Phycisphaerales bacterium]